MSIAALSAGDRTERDSRRGSPFAAKKGEARRESRARAAARVSVPVSEARREWDLPTPEGRGRGALRIALYVLLAMTLHGALVIGLVKFAGEEVEDAVVLVERVFVQTVDLPRWPQKDDEEKSDDVVQEKAAPEPEPTPVARKPRPSKQSEPRDVPRADPLDVERQPEPEPAQPPRRVVGISMESTVNGGKGPAFAVGNTRMGKTDERALDPGEVGKLAPAGARSQGAGSDGPNRVASSLPVDGQKFNKPKRLSAAKLNYPAHLKAQGIDGDVVVLVRITTVGSVSQVKVVKSSGYPEFDEAARQAAVKERYSPATRGGEPVEYSLKYTYRFRVKDA